MLGTESVETAMGLVLVERWGGGEYSAGMIVQTTISMPCFPLTQRKRCRIGIVIVRDRRLKISLNSVQHRNISNIS